MGYCQLLQDTCIGLQYYRLNGPNYEYISIVFSLWAYYTLQRHSMMGVVWLLAAHLIRVYVHISLA